jgi:hypothetical protein
VQKWHLLATPLPDRGFGHCGRMSEPLIERETANPPIVGSDMVVLYSGMSEPQRRSRNFATGVTSYSITKYLSRSDIVQLRVPLLTVFFPLSHPITSWQNQSTTSHQQYFPPAINPSAFCTSFNPLSTFPFDKTMIGPASSLALPRLNTVYSLY